MLGRGLESLIPKKDNTSQSLKPIPPHEEFQAIHSHSGFSPNVSQNIPPIHKPTVHESIFHIEIERIKPNPYQPRHEFSAESLEELAQSIREFGILQPLVVSKVVKETDHGTAVEYQLIAGERRLKAAKLAGLERVPAIVKKVDTGRAKLELALIENVQRSDLNPLEAARAYARLQDEFGLSQREVAARVGKSRETIANALRLLNLPSEIQNALSEGRISESQARMLLSVEDPLRKMELLRGLLERKTTVRELKEKMTEQAPETPEERYIERQLEERLGAPVKVLKEGSRGKLVIQFYSDEEWKGIVDKLLGEDF